MNGEKDCYRCIYYTETNNGPACMNKYVNAMTRKPDPYYCEFCDEISDSYINDMEKLRLNT